MAAPLPKPVSVKPGDQADILEVDEQPLAPAWTAQQEFYSPDPCPVSPIV